MAKLLLFDIDGTLCRPMQKLEQPVVHALQRLKQHGWDIGVIGGSDRQKAIYQLGQDVLDDMDHNFHENGTVYYRNGRLLVEEKLEDFVSMQDLCQLVRFLLKAIVDSNSPVMTGTFIERRSCMINCSPCGRACTKEQRDLFYEWDKKTQCRNNIRSQIKLMFPDLPLEIAVGGQISIDIYPTGLNKTRCLQYVYEKYKEIHFIGDKTEQGGNDYEIYSDPRVIGHQTNSPEQTVGIIDSLL